MKSPMTYTAMRVKQFGNSPSVEVRCFDERAKVATDCLLIFKAIDDVIFYGAENFHPLTKAEAKQVALDAIMVGQGKLQLEAKQRVSELESSRLRQVSRSRQFYEAISGWARELQSLNLDIRNGLDSPTLRTRISSLINSMEKMNPKK